MPVLIHTITEMRPPGFPAGLLVALRETVVNAGSNAAARAATASAMAFYQERIIPWLIHLSMRQRMLAPYRERVVSSARGRVLEVGIGSGLNLPFYASAATEIIGLDPSPKLLEMATRRRKKLQSRYGSLKAGRSPFLRRAWARDGAASALVAGSSHPSLEASVRRLSP